MKSKVKRDEARRYEVGVHGIVRKYVYDMVFCSRLSSSVGIKCCVLCTVG